MYCVKNNQDKYEVLDGQQRTLSFCKFLSGKITDEDSNLFVSLPADKIEQFLNYKLMVFVCEVEELEKLEWFKTINIAGEKLTDQELRNAMYTGPWLLDAKKQFSATNCATAKIGDGLFKYKTIRQKLLEKSIEWKIEFDYISFYMYRYIGTYMV